MKFVVRRILEVYKDYEIEAESEDEAFEKAPLLNPEDINLSIRDVLDGRTDLFDDSGNFIDEYN